MTKEPDYTEQVLVSYLKNKSFEETQDYMRRGRSLANDSTAALKERWVECFKRWAGGNNETAQMKADIEAELDMRRESLPMDAVKAEFAAVIAKAKEAHSELLKNPERHAEIEAGLQADLIKFVEESSGSKN